MMNPFEPTRPEDSLNRPGPMVSTEGSRSPRWNEVSSARPGCRVRASLRRLLALPSLFICVALGCGAGPARVVIVSPTNGEFTTASTVTVQGILIDVNLEAVSDVTVNGVSVGPLGGSASFSVTIPLDNTRIDQPILAEVIGQSGTLLRDRVTLIRGASIVDGDFSPEGVALRLNDSALDQMEDQVTSLVPLEVAELVPAGTLVVDHYCYQDSWFGCLGRVDARVSGTPGPSIDDFSIDVDSMLDFVAGDVILENLFFKVDVYAVTGIGFSCDISVNAATALILGDYDLTPLATDPEQVDVTQLGDVTVSFSQFSSGTNCSGFLGFIVEFFIGLVISDLQNDFVKPGLEDFLNEEDISGNTPIAGAIETALAGIEIAGTIGGALGISLDAPIYGIYEDGDGITVDSDARITVPEAELVGPDLPASYHIDQSFPTFSVLSPNGSAYDLGMSISASAFNQLMKAEVEVGLLISTITEIDLGFGPTPITAGTLALFLPQFAALPPTEALQFEVHPELAPIYTGEVGPNGELATLRISHLAFSVVPTADPTVELLGGTIDVTLGVDVDYGVDGLIFQVTPPTSDEIDVTLLANPLFVNLSTLNLLLPTVIGFAVPTLAGSLDSFPLPEFLGLQLALVEVSRVGEYTSLFFTLSPAP